VLIKLFPDFGGMVWRKVRHPSEVLEDLMIIALLGRRPIEMALEKCFPVATEIEAVMSGIEVSGARHSAPQNRHL
jgi:hypothetical protein